MSAGRILLVDDEPQIRRVLRSTLTSRGYEVHDARTGEDALESIRESRFDLILLDVFNDRVTKIDDPCGAISVHGFCGWLGAVCVGIFADGTYGAGWNGVGAASYLGQSGLGVTGLIHGDSRQFLAQLGGATLCAVWAFGATFVVFKTVNSIKSMRVTKEVETEGLDLPEFGLLGYPEDVYAAEN